MTQYLFLFLLESAAAGDAVSVKVKVAHTRFSITVHCYHLCLLLFLVSEKESKGVLPVGVVPS